MLFNQFTPFFAPFCYTSLTPFSAAIHGVKIFGSVMIYHFYYYYHYLEWRTSVSSEIFNFQLHQARSISLTYSFAYSLTRTQGENIWEECNRTFDRLPLSAVIDHEIFCIHGGTYVDVDSVYTPIDETWKYQKTKHFCVNSTYISIIAAT